MNSHAFKWLHELPHKNYFISLYVFECFISILTCVLFKYCGTSWVYDIFECIFLYIICKGSTFQFIFMSNHLLAGYFCFLWRQPAVSYQGPCVSVIGLGWTYTVLKNVLLCSLAQVCHHFGEPCCLSLQGRRVKMETAGPCKMFLNYYQTTWFNIP